MNKMLPVDSKIILLGFAVVALLTVIIDAGLFIAWALRKEDADAGRKPPLFSPQWSLVDVWAGGQIALILLTVIGVVALIAFSPEILTLRTAGAAIDPVSKLPFLVVTLVAQNVLFFGIPVAFIVAKYHVPLSQIGLPALPLKRHVVWGVGFAIGMMFAVLLVENSVVFTIRHTLGGHFAKWLEDLTKAFTVEGLLGGQMSWAKFLVFLFGAGIAAPIGEEMFFRGFLYNCAKRRFGIAAATIISAAIFALAHMGPIAVIVIFVMGIILAIAYEKTGSLWVTIIMHATNNSVAIIGVFVVKKMGWG